MSTDMVSYDDPGFELVPGETRDEIAEQAVLGWMMNEPDQIPRILEALPRKLPDGASVFDDPCHQAIFDQITDRWGQSEPVDVMTMRTVVPPENLRSKGSDIYLFELTQRAEQKIDPFRSAQAVTGYAYRRALAQTSNRAFQYSTGVRNEEDAREAHTRIMSQLEELSESFTREDGMASVADLALAEMDRYEEMQSSPGTPGTSTGYTDFDELTGGIRGGQLIIVGARPGVGKSTTGLDWCRHIADQGDGALMFSLEMSHKDLMERYLSSKAKVRLQDIRGGSMGDDEWMRLSREVGQLQESRPELHLDQTTDLVVADIAAKTKLKQSEMRGRGKELRLVVVDYLQLMTSGKRVESRQQEVSEFSRKLKLMAKELDVTVVAVCQLNRGPEQRADREPMLSDLRESGSLEQDADIVILLNRPDAYDRDDPRAGEVDLIVAKHRGGATRTVGMAHQLHYARFANLA